MRWYLRGLVLVALAALVAVGGATARSTQAPSNNSSPTISGSATVGSTLTANPGTWSGSAPINFQYQWRICGGNGGSCHDIAGATASTYQVKNGDVGNTLRVRVIGSNSSGSSAATSGASAKIGATPAPAPTGCPKLGAGITVASVVDVNAPARLQIDQFL